MKILKFTIRAMALCACATTVAVGGAQGVELQMDEVLSVSKDAKPTWHSVALADQTQELTVFSMETKKPIGTLKNGTPFLAFGQNKYVATLAYNGQLAFVPSQATEAKFPKRVPAMDFSNFPLPGTTLDERYKQRKNDLDAIIKDGTVALYYGNDEKKLSAVKRQQEALAKQQQANGGGQRSGGGGMGGPGGGGGGGMP